MVSLRREPQVVISRRADGRVNLESGWAVGKVLLVFERLGGSQASGLKPQAPDGWVPLHLVSGRVDLASRISNLGGWAGGRYRIQRVGIQTTRLCHGPSRIRIRASRPLLAYSRIRTLVPDGNSM